MSTFYKIPQVSSSNQMWTTMVLYLCVCVQRHQECGLPALRQLNKVICLQHHETECFSSPHHCLSTAFQVCVCVSLCVCVCVEGKDFI